MVDLLYSLAAHLLRLAAWPTLWWLGRRTPAFRERWGERRARAPFPASHAGGIVVHAVSMGEVAAATPLVEGLLAARPDLPLTFTCTTPTASALIRECFGDRVHHCYLPFDTSGAVRRFLEGTAPRLLVVMETELWPNLLRLAQARGTAVVVAGARLSERSARRYARWPLLTGPLLARVDRLLVQDAAARERFLALGAPPARVEITGSPKFDTPPAADSGALRERFGAMTAGRRVWVAASTHEGEEVLVLDALDALRGRWPDLLLVLVPRHPQRFDAVAALLDRRGLAWQRRSALVDGAVCDRATAVLLGDTMGELRAWYGVAEIAFVGGTLVPRGGHSPLEAMPFGTPVVSGPHVFNFAEVFGALRAADAVCQVADASALAPALQTLLADPAAARALGERARAWHDGQRGAGARSVAAITALLASLPPMVARRDGAWRLRADGERCADATALRLAPQGWSVQAPVEGSGRGSAWFVADRPGDDVATRAANSGVAGVLRHYRRGGRIGRWLGDRYLRVPLAATRPLAEFALLRRLRAVGLPVPRPLLAGVRRGGLFDRGAIVVERIAQARDLAQRLHAAPLALAQWRAVGAAVGRLHAAGVHHRDLNCRNLLLDADDRPWIIDLDGCDVRATGDWAEANLARLERSLRKEAGLRAAAGLPWHGDLAVGWPALRDGHAGAMQAARAGRAGTGLG
jgi:3-deoxy-D-manno-octulosonic-acid transferase